MNSIEALSLSEYTRESLRRKGSGMVDGQFVTGLRYQLCVCNTGLGGTVYRLAYFADKAEAIAEAKKEAPKYRGEDDSAVYVSDSECAGSTRYIAYPGMGTEYVKGRWVDMAA